MTVNEKASSVKEKLIQLELIVLEQYELENEELVKLPSGDTYYCLTLNHIKNKRVLKVWLYFWEVANVFSITIENTETDDDFLLSDWISSTGIQIEQGFFNLNSYKGSFIDQINGFFSALKEVLNHPKMRSILKGESWQETPFDWGNMK